MDTPARVASPIGRPPRPLGVTLLALLIAALALLFLVIALVFTFALLKSALPTPEPPDTSLTQSVLTGMAIIVIWGLTLVIGGIAWGFWRQLSLSYWLVVGFCIIGVGTSAQRLLATNIPAAWLASGTLTPDTQRLLLSFADFSRPVAWPIFAVQLAMLGYLLIPRVRRSFR